MLFCCDRKFCSRKTILIGKEEVTFETVTGKLLQLVEKEAHCLGGNPKFKDTIIHFRNAKIKCLGTKNVPRTDCNIKPVDS